MDRVHVADNMDYLPNNNLLPSSILIRTSFIYVLTLFWKVMWFREGDLQIQ